MARALGTAYLAFQFGSKLSLLIRSEKALLLRGVNLLESARPGSLIRERSAAGRRVRATSDRPIPSPPKPSSTRTDVPLLRNA